MKDAWGVATGAVLLFVAWAGGVAIAGDATAGGEQTLGYLLEGPHQTAEVKIDRQKGVVSVKVNPDPGISGAGQPKHIDLTLRLKDREPFTVSLGASEVLENRSVIYGGQAPLGGVEGSLSPQGGSFVGIELRIPLSAERADVLQWTDNAQ